MHEKKDVIDFIKTFGKFKTDIFKFLKKENQKLMFLYYLLLNFYYAIKLCNLSNKKYDYSKVMLIMYDGFYKVSAPKTIIIGIY